MFGAVVEGRFVLFRTRAPEGGGDFGAHQGGGGGCHVQIRDKKRERHRKRLQVAASRPAKKTALT